MSSTFAGKVVFITGAASGLGRATALAFAAEGAALSLMDVNEAGLAQTKADVEQLGAACLTRTSDVSRKANCTSAIAATVEHYGQLDVLCNVAGVVGFYNVPEISEEQWERSIGINLNGPFYLSQAAIPHLLKAHGNIVNVASVNGIRGSAHVVPYSTAKAGLIHMTRSMAMEYMHQPIRINVIVPGFMDTPIVNTITFPDGMDQTLTQRFHNMRPATDPAEVAQFILYLASDKAPSIHGACLPIDCGTSTG